VVVLASAASVTAYSHFIGPTASGGGDSKTKESSVDQQLQAELAQLSSPANASASGPVGRGNQSASTLPLYSRTPGPVGAPGAPVRQIPSMKEIDLSVIPSVGYNHSYFKSPIIVVIGINNTVVWINTDATWHTVKSLNGTFDSGNIWTDNAFKFTFTKPGVYPYICQYHAYMRGTIIVKAQSS
jgi:hypothetical protein